MGRAENRMLAACFRFQILFWTERTSHCNLQVTRLKCKAQDMGSTVHQGGQSGPERCSCLLLWRYGYVSGVALSNRRS